MHGGNGSSFSEFRVYSPALIADEAMLPPCATNIVLPSPLTLAMWEQLILPRAMATEISCFAPAMQFPF